MKLKALIGAGLAFARKHEGTILTVCSMASTVAAVYFAMRDSDKIAVALDEIRNDHEMSKIDKAKTLLKPSARVLVSTGASLGFQLANHKFASNTISSLTNAVTMYKTLNDEKEKAIEKVVGTEKAEEIHEEASRTNAAERYEETTSEKRVIQQTGKGNDLFYDEYLDIFFYSDINFVKARINDMNEQINSSIPITVGEYAYNLNLKAKPYGKDLVWDLGNKISPSYYPAMDETEHVYTIISHRNTPNGTRRRW